MRSVEETRKVKMRKAQYLIYNMETGTFWYPGKVNRPEVGDVILDRFRRKLIVVERDGIGSSGVTIYREIVNLPESYDIRPALIRAINEESQHDE